MAKSRSAESQGSRQKIIAIILVVLVVFIIWQVKGLFGGSVGNSSTPTAAEANVAAQKAKIAAEAPKPAVVAKSTADTVRVSEMTRLQEEAQLKYLSAINELQMLKVSKDIAEANEAIAKSKLSTVESQKKIVDAIAPPPPPPPTPAVYAQTLTNPVQANAVSQAPAKQTAKYTVISVSNVFNGWTAVLGADGNLYKVNVGDVLPLDGAKVVSIDRNGVVLDRDGVKEKLSLVAVI